MRLGMKEALASISPPFPPLKLHVLDNQADRHIGIHIQSQARSPHGEVALDPLVPSPVSDGFEF